MCGPWNRSPSVLLNMIRPNNGALDYVYNLCCGLVSVVNLIGVQSIRIGGDISVLGSTFLNMVRTTLHEQFYPLNSTDSIEIELINSDYEHVRCAMVIMSMDELFKR